MTYDQSEQSVALGRPFEVYNLVTPQDVFRYASGPQDRMVDGQLYKSAVVTRTSIVKSGLLDGLQTMDFNFPRNHKLAAMYMSRVTPEALTVQVLKGHDGTDYNIDFKIAWRGEAVGYDINRDWFTVSTVSRLQSQIINSSSEVLVQNGCNNRVYDERCQALSAPHTWDAEVVKHDNQSITVSALGFDDGELNLGSMTNLRTNEARTISSSIATVVTVSYPFLDMKTGDTVRMVKGCDNKMDTCRTRFNNVQHYNGFRFVPLGNPFG